METLKQAIKNRDSRQVKKLSNGSRLYRFAEEGKFKEIRWITLNVINCEPSKQMDILDGVVSGKHLDICKWLIDYLAENNQPLTSILDSLCHSKNCDHINDLIKWLVNKYNPSSDCCCDCVESRLEKLGLKYQPSSSLSS